MAFAPMGEGSMNTSFRGTACLLNARISPQQKTLLTACVYPWACLWFSAKADKNRSKKINPCLSCKGLILAKGGPFESCFDYVLKMKK